MNRAPGILLCSLLLVASAVYAAAAQPPAVDATSPAAASSESVPISSGGFASFAAQVDLSPFDRLAVQTEGRLKSFESFARGEMKHISGSRSINGQSPGFTYLDLMLRPDAYTEVDLIYVKSRQIRNQIVRALETSPTVSGLPDLEERMKRFRKTGLISESFLRDPQVRMLLDSLRNNLITTGKYVEMTDWAVQAKRPERLRSILRLVPPADDRVQGRWISLHEMAMAGHQGQSAAALGESTLELSRQWLAFVNGWRNLDAPAVNNAAMKLSLLLPAVNPGAYPDQTRLAWESWYFRAKNMTWVWLIYALALVPLLLAITYRWKTAGRLGMGLFIIAFALHTFAIILRWYVASRWPNSNMFEAVTTSAWFGGCFAILAEPLLRRTPLKNLIALCSAAGSMVALMAAHFMPLQLDPNISNMMPVLHDVWLYIHVNVIIFAYALIFMASVPALVYLLVRTLGRSGTDDYARAGGVASLILPGPGIDVRTEANSATFGQVLDGVTMVLMQLSFIMLWAGIVMGAIWADHSWGRPWGWDPKEVFALNTFLVYAVLIHVRLRVLDKGLWTALLAVFGCAVMLFNWIFINFYLVGLHSYA